jgi:hypothetical protein
VTTKRCKCGYLERASDEPSVGIAFDSKTNEYEIVGQNGTLSVIYHCPWCGGSAPPSKRPTLFAAVAPAEVARLRALATGLSSLDEAVARFGPPAKDQAHGTTITTPGSEGKPSVTTSHRCLTFTHLSETLDVVIEDHGLRGVRLAFLPKYIGEPGEGGA